MNLTTKLDLESLFHRLESFFVLASLFSFLASPLKLLALSEASQSFQAGSNILEQLLFLGIHVVSLCLIIIKRKTIYSELVQYNKLAIVSLAILLVAIMLSALWSEYPDITIRRAIALWGTTLFAIYFSSCFTFEKQFSFLAQTFSIVAVLCLIIALLFPSYGIMSGTHAGAWRGVFLHKNGLGSSMVLGLLVFVMRFFGDSRHKASSLFLMTLSAFLLVMSTSKNSLVIVLVLMMLLPILSFLKLRLDVMVPVILGSTFVMTLGTVVVLENIGALLKLLGKDPTLTGRTDIWPYVWEAIDKKIWLGYGYQGFWQGFDSEAAKIWYTVGWEPTHPHNGLLELLLIFGFLFTTLFILVFILLYIRSIALIGVSRSTKLFLPLIFLTYTLISNIGETKILEYNDISWVLFISMALCVSKPLNTYKSFKQVDTSNPSSG